MVILEPVLNLDLLASLKSLRSNFNATLQLIFFLNMIAVFSNFLIKSNMRLKTNEKSNF